MFGGRCVSFFVFRNPAKRSFHLISPRLNVFPPSLAAFPGSRFGFKCFCRSGRTCLSLCAGKHRFGPPGLFWRCSLLQDNRWEGFRRLLPLKFAKNGNMTSLSRVAAYSTERWGHKRGMRPHVTLFCSRYFVYVSYQHVSPSWRGAEKLLPGRFRASRWISQLPLRLIWWKSLWTGSQLCCTLWHHGTFLCERGLSEGRGEENERAC